MLLEVKQQARRIRKAQIKLEQGLQGLRLSDGGSRYSEQEERRLKQELVAAANEATEGVEDMISEGYVEVTLIEKKKFLPGFAYLDNRELARANNLRGFVADDVEKSDLAALADRVAAVAAHGDDVLRSVYAEHIGYKMDAIRASQARTVSTLDGQKTVPGKGPQ